MTQFLIVYVTKKPFMGTGHLCVSAVNEEVARDLFIKAFPMCAIQALLELR